MGATALRHFGAATIPTRRSGASPIHGKSEPLFKPIQFEVDLEARTARLHVPGVLDTRVEPIKNKVTGALHRARIALPFGKEFALAEVASGSTRATGKVPLESTNTHAHVVHNRLTAQGVAPEPQG
jgi:hypothetical protein